MASSVVSFPKAKAGFSMADVMVHGGIKVGGSGAGGSTVAGDWSTGRAMMSTCMNSSSSWLCGVGAGGGAMGALKNGKKGMARFSFQRGA
eukprot:jgi/Chrpa1/3206/Chrysochromulina_OHIO_Genome00002386-RA